MSHKRAIEELLILLGTCEPRLRLFEGQYRMAPSSVFALLLEKVDRRFRNIEHNVKDLRKLKKGSTGRDAYENFTDNYYILLNYINMEQESSGTPRDLIDLIQAWKNYCGSAEELLAYLQKPSGSPLRTMGLLAIAGYLGWKVFGTKKKKTRKKRQPLPPASEGGMQIYF